MPSLPFARLLVTGADGFVGRHLVPALVDRLAPGARLVRASRMAAGAGDRVTLDLTRPDSVAAAVAAVRPDLVVHLAAQASVGQSLGAGADTWGVNLGGSLAIARAIAGTVPDCTLLQVSSAEVYGLAFNDGPVTEASPVRPQSAYARSKAAAEWMLADALPPTAKLVTVRPSNHSGRGQDVRFVLPSFAAQIAAVERGEAAAIEVGNLEAERDFLDVRDVVAAYLALLEAAPGLPGRSLFNVASGRTERIGDLLGRLVAMSSAEVPVRQDPARLRPSEVPRAAIDHGALGRATGWSPTHGLDMMLADLLADARAA